MNQDLVIGYCTVGSDEQAQKIAKILLEEKLAACVNTIPGLRSAYWWHGQIEEATELLLIIKTRASHTDEIIQVIKREHEYEVPEVIFIPIIKGSQEYLDWILDSTDQTGA